MTKVGLVVDGVRWEALNETITQRSDGARRLSLEGLVAAVCLDVGAELGRTMEQLEVAPRLFCRHAPVPSDGEAVDSGFEVISAPQVDESDTGAGLSLEAMRCHALAQPEAIVMVGAAMPWVPLARRLESLRCALFEYLIPPPGKVVISGARRTDLRATLAQQPVAAKFAPLMTARLVSAAGPSRASGGAPVAEPKPADVVYGTVKMLAQGYGIVTRSDGGGDIEFMANQVAPPGFEFLELGDRVRFGVERTPSGKWRAVRVVRA
ncbi:MAG: cold shock domain-containing protein [Casimicrobiaceae bacterium]|nr:cold shock domain-containing protein [Casimicrobiaceae bacterium]MCX8097987.1 cold shock domain-containing protein [Casimicrobiaceae bacterium]MDW8311718.1 cold shock domain-containing protein [Burkholderiales bacterium]